MSKDDSDTTYTVHQAHERVGKENITVQGLYLAAERGDFPSFRIGRRILIPKDTFEAFLLGEKSPKAVVAESPKDLGWDYSTFKAHTAQTPEEHAVVVEALRRHRVGPQDQPHLTYRPMVEPHEDFLHDDGY